MSKPEEIPAIKAQFSTYAIRKKEHQLKIAAALKAADIQPQDMVFSPDFVKIVKETYGDD